MNPGDAVRDALDALASELTPFLSLRETVELLGGTRSASAAFGVTQRTVQRWLKLNGGQQRSLAGSHKRIRDAVAAEQKKLAAEQLRDSLSEGFSVDSRFKLRVSKDISWREKEDIEIEEPSDDDINALIDAWLANDKEGMASAFQSAFLGGWGQGRLDAASIEEIDSVTLIAR